MMHGTSKNLNIATMDQLVAAEKILSEELNRLYEVIDELDHLKSNQSLRWLRDEILITEKKTRAARLPFNNAVIEYNQYRQSFPSAFLAANLGHTLNGAVLTIW